MRHIKTEEERIARKLADLVSDLRVDLEMVGEYFYQLSPNVAINRILLVAEVIQDEKERKKYLDE